MGRYKHRLQPSSCRNVQKTNTIYKKYNKKLEQDAFVNGKDSDMESRSIINTQDIMTSERSILKGIEESLETVD